MQEETQDKNNWRERLGALDEIPGERSHLSPEAWEKLNAKLERKAAPVNTFWWLLAAACALLIFFIGNTNREEYKTVEMITNSESQSPSKIILYQPKSIIKSNVIVARKKQVRTYSPKIMASDTSVNVMEDTSETIPVLAKVDTPAMPAVKKLRVVHINELESNTVQRRNQLVRNTPSDKIIKIHLAPSN